MNKVALGFFIAATVGCSASAFAGDAANLLI